MFDTFYRLITQFKYIVASIIILSSTSIIAINFPSENQYNTLVDEGNYYRQGKILADNGFSGFKMITDAYINTPALQDAPNPFRIGANVLVGIFLAVDESYFSISVLCLLSFIVFLAGTFHFLDRYWGTPIAVLSIILLSFSPLEMAMARRALMDIPAMMALAFSCYTFWCWIDTKRRKYLLSFIGLTVASVLLKEVNVIFLLFFAIVLIYLRNKKKHSITMPESVVALLSPTLIIGVIYLLVLGIDDAIVLFKTMYNAVSNSAYSAKYGQGPWYRLLIDYLMLSPYVVILAIGYIWHYLLYQKSDNKTDYILILSLFMILAFSVLPKNVRYAIFFDVPLRILAANGLFVLVRGLYKRQLNWQLVALVLFLLFTDVDSFYTYFIDHDIYDPISNNLLKANSIIPG